MVEYGIGERDIFLGQWSRDDAKPQERFAFAWHRLNIQLLSSVTTMPSSLLFKNPGTTGFGVRAI